MNRRLFVAAVGATGLGATAGCLDRFLASATTFAASPAVVADAAADEVGYEYRGTAETVETETVAGETVEATNYGSEYTRTIDASLADLEGETETETGVFGVVTTPKVSVAGEDFNPVGHMSRAEIALEVQHRYDDLAVDDAPIGRRTVETLGTAITVDTFEGTATFGEYDDVDVYLDVSQPDHGDDHLVVVAIYPDARGFDRASEVERIDTLIRGLEHGDDVDVDIREA
ncbi:DUF6517 family protein [Halopiger aswanensis]|uniref:Lipoprotein n=1 Tax=Halopiger aswanensis TaxID=148449 RepID=A0A3R7FWW4_9EURY|nr:DUF6517 family protein [Halopiger aswanensis]RKD97067.1 hypothetical protein ATJ93_0048 [Halopiger aswanensis]